MALATVSAAVLMTSLAVAPGAAGARHHVQHTTAKPLVSYAVRDRFHGRVSTLRVLGDGTARLTVAPFRRRPGASARLRLGSGELQRLRALIQAAGFERLLPGYHLHLPEQTVIVTHRGHRVQLGAAAAPRPPARLARLLGALSRIYARAQNRLA